MYRLVECNSSRSIVKRSKGEDGRKKRVEGLLRVKGRWSFYLVGRNGIPSNAVLNVGRKGDGLLFRMGDGEILVFCVTHRSTIAWKRLPKPCRMCAGRVYFSKWTG